MTPSSKAHPTGFSLVKISGVSFWQPHLKLRFADLHREDAFLGARHLRDLAFRDCGEQEHEGALIELDVLVAFEVELRAV